jgi:hypothetical protein
MRLRQVLSSFESRYLMYCLSGNPFVTQIARETGKDAYAGVRAWLQLVITKLSTLNNPILVMESWQDGCHVMFILRGNSVGQHYAAPPSARKDDASPSRPFQPTGGLMEPINASLQRGRQG